MVFISLLSVSSFAAREVTSVITRVVGQAKDQFVTSREVRINDAVEQILISKTDAPKAPHILNGNEKTFATQVSDVLVEWSIYFEAKSFAADSVSNTDLHRSLKVIEVATAKSSDWRGLEVSTDELHEMLVRKLTAKSFMRLKTESSTMPVTDSEAMAYFKKNRVKFGNMPFETFRDNIKNYLRQQQMDHRMKDWLEVLERKYKVRNFIAG